MSLNTNSIRTHQVRMVFDSCTNDQGTLFGGTALQWMDEVAYVTASRYTKRRVVTTAVDGIRFFKPIPAASIVELVGQVIHVGRVKLTIGVELFVEEKYNASNKRAMQGNFTFVILDERNRPVRLERGIEKEEVASMHGDKTTDLRGGV